MTHEAIREAVKRLSIPERWELVEELWDDLATDPSAFEMTDELKAKLDRRIAAAEADPDGGIPWEQVREELVRRYHATDRPQA
jgi:putative addiction module component (TIGR02574 family)